MKPVYKMEKISFSYIFLQQKKDLIKDLTFEILPGEIISIIGPESCGKSTILALICGLLEPTHGYMFCNNIHIGYMLQNGDIFQWHNVYRNFSKTFNNNPKSQNIFDISKSDNCCTINSSSKCCIKKASLIKTLSSEPDLLLLDEPFSYFDKYSRKIIRNDIINLIHKEGKSAIFVSSDINEALSISDRVFILSEAPCYITKEFNTKITAF